MVLPVTESLIERECTIQVRKWRESRGELTHQPSRRLNGTRAIHEQKRRASAISSGGSFSFLGGGTPAPGPLRASSSLLSLPGFRRSKAPFHALAKKASFSGPSGADALPPLHRPPATTSPVRGPTHKPPLPGVAPRAAVTPHIQSPLVLTVGAPATAQPPKQPVAPQMQADPPAQPTSHNPPHQPALLPPTTLTPSPVVEQVTPSIPSPMAHNAPLMPGPQEAPTKEGSPVATVGPEEPADGGKKKRRSKEDKRKEKEDEKQKLKEMKEKKERDKTEKERQKKEKERHEKERKRERSGKKKTATAAGPDAPVAGERNGGGAPKDSA